MEIPVVKLHRHTKKKCQIPFMLYMISVVISHHDSKFAARIGPSRHNFFLTSKNMKIFRFSEQIRPYIKIKVMKTNSDHGFMLHEKKIFSVF